MLCRRWVLSQLKSFRSGRLIVREEANTYSFGDPTEEECVRIDVRDVRFWSHLVASGGLGAAESYLRGYWETEDLTKMMQLFTRSAGTYRGLRSVAARLVAPLRQGWHWLNRNTRSGSRRNIAAHYDLSNDFFELMLDSTMTYSAGVFNSPTDTLDQASLAKYDRLCRKLQLSKTDSVLEIGCGWGGFAEYAARRYGCKVTAVTISAEQHRFAVDRIQQAGLSDRVKVLLRDYRDISDQFDKIVSIEMIEAVGEKYLDGYFRQCSRLLRQEGMMALQAITIPDHEADEYRRNVDFIQAYIFPGGFLPSMSAIGRSLRRATDFRVFHQEDFGTHYAETLRRWKTNFRSQLSSVRRLGFDDRFIRMWNYYLSYCEAGFLERHVGLSQMVLTKPLCRREPILSL